MLLQVDTGGPAGRSRGPAKRQRCFRQKLAERQKLLSQLDQATMQEQLNTARWPRISQTVGQDVPSVRRGAGPRSRRSPRRPGDFRVVRSGTSRPVCSRSSRQSVNIEAPDTLGDMRAQMGLPGQAGVGEARARHGRTVGGQDRSRVPVGRVSRVQVARRRSGEVPVQLVGAPGGARPPPTGAGPGQQVSPGLKRPSRLRLPES